MSDLHVVIAPDSFKGSLSARQVADAIAVGLAQLPEPPRVTLAPMADGGEGLLDAIAARCAGHSQEIRVIGVHRQSLTARWYAMTDGTAVIESAEVLGLPLIEATRDAPALSDRSSYGLGTLIADALDSGARDIAVGLGGSATNDAGLGMLLALGARARDADDAPIAPTMAGLLRLARLDLSGLDARLAETRLRAFCDVDNPLLGPEGASRVYGPQKGLTDTDIADVEAAFEQLAEQSRQPARAEWPGSGAAGGLGFALALLDARLESGADAVIGLTGLAAHIKDADAVITGEGRSDRQTLSGKLPMAVAKTAGRTPTHLVAGAISDDARDELAQHFASLSTLVETAGSQDAALAEPARWLGEIARALAPRLRTGAGH
ncbi:glycerate kinase [Salinisphaera sp. Q1T1-3]|uniref:glycerate kinase n=1 Tax=Salinisphaera sp. Q1T1-3 TaxID=2321229 RepID=UPI000E75546C|nr:glycerate kinase [Salinisphaera sp. Q1T1-3]RJS92856.1 glycerate kinase [Salinisphaera sp. Q1T1-3]